MGTAKKWINVVGVMFLLMYSCVSWAASDCNTASKYISPCSNFLTNGSPPPVITDPCCQGARRLYKQGVTRQDRQQICQCLKNSATSLKLNDTAVAGLAPLCGIKLPYVVTKNINCSAIP